MCFSVGLCLLRSGLSRGGGGVCSAFAGALSGTFCSSSVNLIVSQVQEECYTSLDICTVARTNPNAIVEVVQVPSHFPNR